MNQQEPAYAVRDGDLVPETESRLRREMRQRKNLKINRRALRVIAQLQAQESAK